MLLTCVCRLGFALLNIELVFCLIGFGSVRPVFVFLVSEVRQ